MTRAMALVGALLYAAAPGSPARAVPTPAAPLRIAVLGDSLALGTGAADPTNALSFRIYRALAATHPGSEITDRAIGGSRAADVLRLQVASLDSHATDVVFLIVGGNDVVFRTPVAAFARDYGRLLVAIRRRVPNAIVLAFGVPDVGLSPIFADSRAKTEARSRADDAAVRNVAARQRCTFVDLFAFTHAEKPSAEFFSNDDFHPSDAGYERLATFALPAVRRAVAGR